MRFLIALNAAVGAVFFICYSYHLIYLVAGLFRKKRESAPGELRDFAVLIPARNEEKVIGKLLESVQLFDVYRDDVRVGAGKKSMAYALTYRAADRTLTSEEVEKAHERLVKKVSGATGAEIRG